MTTVLKGFDELQSVYDDVQADADATDYSQLLNGTIDKLESQHLDMFNSEQDSSGEPWAPLRPSTIKRKGHAIRLVERGDLKESLAGRSGDSIRDVFREQGLGITALVFGTSDEKAGFHQEGTSRMPARPPVGITDELTDEITEGVASETVRQLTEV